jgi:glutaredoxin
MIIRTVACLLAIFFSDLGQAEIYTWKDAQGRTHFGDRPPADSTPKQLELKINTIHRPEVQRLDTDTDLEMEMAVERKVVIYSTDWCGVCTQAKRHFKRNNIPYKEYDVEKSARGRRDFKRLKGSGVPIILVGNQRMNGFSAERFDLLYHH